jgi:poly(3-hydroxybutyrate) depolymerase
VGNALLQPSSWRAALLLGVCGAGLVCGSSAAAQGLSEQNLAGRSALIYVPSQLPAPGARALVIVLHGGLGNARRIVAGQSETGMNMDAEAEKNQFVVASNVPIDGGRGTQGLSRAVYNSEEHSRRTLVDSGASYDLLVLQGADHSLDHIEAALQAREHLSIAQKAERFFGLASPGR